ncbi:MCE family protein|uniref:Phospholipid/cholesterol/gamma-HCH transport system substrate-binding protein n=1 Tax=Dendrosporobacter quercicolus TaxID=146817 RepID=A0A1G9R3X7_9FIRM|nr:MlaD family protein [Dendrosporobacter quercicolus]NSL48470.1 MCE family protein [Dendrosporobacter quercicolus DSM 1736]SDM17954.1 phospholipid/cholesterol/gamma-HCH transport system substrate-binding protein [Dendrosporobacter quercicolus]
MLSTEAKVGSITIVAIALLTYMIIHLGGFAFRDQGYPVHAVFNQVNGLKEGNLVRYAGVDIGKVNAVQMIPSGVQVTMLIHTGTKIPETARFSIGTDGLLGEKYIDIAPPREPSGVLAPGATVRGENIQGLDQMVATADQVLHDVQKLVNSLNEVFGDETFKASLKESVVNTRAITANLNAMSAAMARMAVNNEADIQAMVSNLEVMSASLRSVAARVDKMIDGVDNNGQTARDLRETIGNLHSTSVRVENMAAALEGIVSDPATAENIKETLKNARSVSAKADRMLTKVTDIKAETGVEMLYDSDSGNYSTNAEVRLHTSPRDFAVIGVNDIGQDSKTNLQFGTGTDKLAGRAGIIDSKAGVGIDSSLGKQLKLSLDVYDPNDVRVKLRTQYRLAPDLFVVAQANNMNKDEDNNTYIGIRRNF